MEKIQYYIEMLGDTKGALSSVSSLKSLDDAAAKTTTSIKRLEVDVGAATKKLESLKSADGVKGIAMELADAKAKLDAIRSGKTPFDAGEYKRASDSVGKLGSQLDAAKSKNAAAIGAQQSKVEALTGKLNEQKAAQASSANLVAAKRAQIVKGLDEQVSKLGGVLTAAKDAGGPVGNLAGKLEGLSKGGAVGAAVAVVVALAAIATGAVLAVAALAKYAFTASDAARSSLLLSEAATGSAAGGKELEIVVDQLSGKFGTLRGKTAEWGRELSIAEIKGRDMQRTLTTMGLVANAVGDGGAAKIKGIAEASRMAGKLMLGARDRFGEFASLQGTGIKAADIYASVATSMKTSIPEAQRLVKAGIVPFRKGLEALEQAAEAKFGPIVARQMMSLDVQATKLKENIGKLFSGANIDKFLAGLKTVTDLFDTNTVTGYILREVMTAAFTKIAEVSAKVFPYVKAAIEGVVFGVLLVANVAKKLYDQFQKTFGGTTKNIDGVKLAFEVGAMAVGLFVGSIVGLTAAFALLAVVALTATAPIWIPFAVAAVAIYLMVSAVESAIDSITSIGNTIGKIDLADAAGKMIDGLVKGIKSKIGDVKSAILEVSGAITSAFNTDQEIRSPGRKAFRGGANVVKGSALGMESELPMVERASLAASNAATGDPQSGNGSSGGGGFNPEKVELHFHVAEAGDLPGKVREVIVSLMMGEMRGNAMVPT